MLLQALRQLSVFRSCPYSVPSHLMSLLVVFKGCTSSSNSSALSPFESLRDLDAGGAEVDSEVLKIDSEGGWRFKAGLGVGGFSPKAAAMRGIRCQYRIIRVDQVILDCLSTR